MTPILLTIALAGLLHITQFVVASYMANVDMCPGYTTSPRDHDSTRPVRTTTGRMLRAYDNNVQMFPFFASGVLLIHLTDQATGVTVGAAWVYITARALYIPAYALGWQPWRSYIWLVAMAAVATLFIASLI